MLYSSSSKSNHTTCHRVFSGWPGMAFRQLSQPVSLNVGPVRLLQPTTLNRPAKLNSMAALLQATITQQTKRVKGQANKIQYAHADAVKGSLGKYHGRVNVLGRLRHDLASKHGEAIARREAGLKDLERTHAAREELYRIGQQIRDDRREGMHAMNPRRAGLRLSKVAHTIGHAANLARGARALGIGIAKRELAFDKRAHEKLAGNQAKLKERVEKDKGTIIKLFQGMQAVVSASPKAKTRVITLEEAKKITRSPAKQTLVMRAFSGNEDRLTEYWSRLFAPETQLSAREMISLFRWCHTEVIEGRGPRGQFEQAGREILRLMDSNAMRNLQETAMAEGVRAKLESGRKVFDALRTAAIGPQGKTSKELDKVEKLHAANPRAAFILLEAVKEYGEAPEELTNTLRTILTPTVIDALGKKDPQSVLALLEIGEEVRNAHEHHKQRIISRLKKNINLADINALVPERLRTFPKSLVEKATGETLDDIVFSIINGKLLPLPGTTREHKDKLALFAAAALYAARKKGKQKVDLKKDIPDTVLVKLTKTP